MSIQGTICGYHARLPRFAVTTPEGFSIVDVVIGELSVGDQVRGNLWTLGATLLENDTTGEIVEVFVEAVHASRAAAESLLRSR